MCLSCRGKTIMLDCGIHPGHHGIQSLPFFDDVDLEEVDIALITHFHLDHCAAVPYLACKTKFKVSFCTTRLLPAPQHNTNNLQVYQSASPVHESP